MKKLTFLLLGLIAAEAYGQISRIFEAENAMMNDSVKIMNDNTSSNNKCLSFGKDGSIKWEVDNPSSGWYNIAVRYRAVEGDMAQVIDVNGKKHGLGFSMCNNWNDASFKTYLQKGSNEITMTPDYGKVHIDYLSIPEDSLLLLPAISPVNGVFYKDHPTTLTIFTDAKGKKLKTIQSAGRSVNFQIIEYVYLEGAYHVALSKESLLLLPLGNNLLNFEFDDGSMVTLSLAIKQTVDCPGLTLILFDVEHGNAVLVILPDGKKLLIDSGKEAYAKTVVMPFLDSNHIDSIDYFIITHYHDDHMGAKDEIIKKYNVSHVFDYKSFNSGDTLKLDKAIATMLNAFADGIDENTRSLSFLLNWNGFTYSHGADNYAQNQDCILKKLGNRVSADVFYANHHFHGSVNPNFIMWTNPVLVVVSAQQAVYARGAYADIYKEQTEKNLYAAHARLKETLLTLETGTVVVRVNNSGDWSYETYRDNNDIFLPGCSE
jgi:competence protein ComEC